MGKVKQGVGEAVGSERMKREGQSQEIKGDAQQALGKAKDAVKALPTRQPMRLTSDSEQIG